MAEVVLRGRFDTTGAVVVELPFHKIATEKGRIIVDLSAVNFLSSYRNSRAAGRRQIVNGKGGQMVMVCPTGPSPGS